MGILENFQAMLARGQDSPLLRYSIGNALLKQGDARTAAEHLGEALRQDPGYTAAWKIYAKALLELQDLSGACRAFEQGIAVAETNGDIQAAREMRVFLKRAQKAQAAG